MAIKKNKEETSDEKPIDPFIAGLKSDKFAGRIGFGSFITRREGISTGSMSLDLKLGGSLPRDRVIEYYGPPSSCKTSMGLRAMRSYVEKFGYDKKKPFIIDIERSITADLVEGMGLDPSKIFVVLPETGEEALDTLINIVRSGKFGFGLYDSIDAMETEKESHRTMTDQSMGELPKLMSRIMRKLCKATIDNDCGVIFINQIRSSLSMYGSPEVSSGGAALKYYSHIRIRWKAEPSKEVKGALRLHPAIKKNKTSALISADSEFDFFPGRDVELFSDYLETSKQIGTIITGGPYYQLIGDNDEMLNKFKGANAIRDWLKENPSNLKTWGELIHTRWKKVCGTFHVEEEPDKNEFIEEKEDD